MADDNAPAAAPAANTTINRPAPSTPAETAAREGRNPTFQPAMGAAPTPKHVARSPLITNPTPMRDPDTPEAVDDNTPSELPASTLAEMEAGRKALERNKPVNTRAARNREGGSDDRLEGGRITTETNPVDATQRMQQNKTI